MRSVQSLHQEGSGWQIATETGVLTADAVLCTLPSYVLANLLSQEDEVYQQQLKTIPYLGAVIVVLKSSQKLSDYYWHNIHDPQAPFVSFLNHTALVKDGRYGGQVYYMGAYRPHTDVQFQGTDAEILELYLGYLARMFPQFDRSQLSHAQVFRMPNAQHVPVGRYRRLIPEVESPFNGLFLSNFSQVFPQDRGTNAAVAEGLKAAASIRRYLLS
ncbi:MAG: FAD-dependent oxidoreductase [Bacteroidetes bacterium]|nr:FAD-dependent oxidoreductase [Bacteroidota bacterium]